MKPELGFVVCFIDKVGLGGCVEMSSQVGVVERGREEQNLSSQEQGQCAPGLFSSVAESAVNL